MAELAEIRVGDRVKFHSHPTFYEVTYVGAKYFHIQTANGVSGPYPPGLVEKVQR